jgi:Na+-transporting NADH:ubiquinone oxidoreductase subunit NqrC
MELFDKNGNILNIEDVLNQLNNETLTSVNRVEIIDEKGRRYVNCDNNNNVKILVQDDNRTIKIFISKNLSSNNS